MNQTIIPAKDAGDDSPFVLAGFTCPESGQGFFLLAWDESGNSTLQELAALLPRVGCPSSGSPRYNERRTACEVGATDYCP